MRKRKLTPLKALLIPGIIGRFSHRRFEIALEIADPNYFLDSELWQAQTRLRKSGGYMKRCHCLMVLFVSTLVACSGDNSSNVNIEPPKLDTSCKTYTESYFKFVSWNVLGLDKAGADYKLAEKTVLESTAYINLMQSELTTAEQLQTGGKVNDFCKANPSAKVAEYLLQ